MNPTVKDLDIDDVELSPLIQEKIKSEDFAGFTCDKCPQPKKPFYSSIGLYELQKPWYRLDMPFGGVTTTPL